MNTIRENEIKNCIEEVKPLIECNILGFKCYSPQYHKSVLLNLYSKKDSFACLYGDFNKLSVINNTYGEKEGDNVFACALEEIKELLPDDAIISRIGGDEFCFILPNKTASEANHFIRSIDMSLKEKENLLHGLSITMAARDTSCLPATIKSTQPVLPYLLEAAETDVLEMKQKNRLMDTITCQAPLPLYTPETLPKKHSSIPFIEDDQTKKQEEIWKSLNARLHLAAKEHLRDIRPSQKYIFSTADMKKETTAMGKALTNILFHQETKASSHDNSRKFKRDLIKNTKALHSLFSSPNLLEIFQELGSYQLEEALYKDIFALQRSLAHNEHSDLLNRSYLELYLTPKICENLSHMHATIFSACGIRVCNTAFGHLHGDTRIKKTAHLLKKAIEERLCYSNDTFCFAKPFYFLIDRGCGNYILLTPEHFRSAFVKEIESIVNAEYDKQDPNSSFQISSSQKSITNGIPTKYHPYSLCHQVYQKRYQKHPTSRNQKLEEYFRIKCENLSIRKQKHFLDAIFELQHKADFQKDALKSNSLDSIDAKLAEESVYKECVKYYNQHVENNTSNEMRKLFIKNAFSALVNEYSLHNESARQAIKNNFVENLAYHTSIVKSNITMKKQVLTIKKQRETKKSEETIR